MGSNRRRRRSEHRDHVTSEHRDIPRSEAIQGTFLELVGRADLASKLSREGSGASVGHLPGAAPAAFAVALRDAGVGCPVVVVAESPGRADEVHADIEALTDGGARCFPQRETLPYEDADPHVEIAAQRVDALASLLAGRTSIVVTTVRALAERTPVPTAPGESFIMTLARGDAIGLHGLVERLERMGFERSSTVREVGDFALRGGLIDLFPFGHASPVRVELWGDDIESIRLFDALTQRSTERVETVEILPIDVAPDGDATEFRSLLELLPESSVLVRLQPELDFAAHERLWEEVRDARGRAGEGAAPVEALVEPPREAAERIASLRRIDVLESRSGAGPEEEDPEVDVVLGIEPPPAIDRDMGRLVSVLTAAVGLGERPTILCDNDGQVERLEEILHERGSPTLARSVAVAIGSLSGGFRVGGARPVMVLTDHEIFRRTYRRARTRFRGAATLESIASIQPGDYVVHMDHGIGRYRGIERVEVGGETIETLAIEYADRELLKLPHYRLDLIERWNSSSGEELNTPPPVHKLGGKRWKQLKRRTVNAIEASAVELLQLYAKRQLSPGRSFSSDTTWQREMESAFLYDETPDQLEAWTAVRSDLEAGRPMDRLICGDVGFGKTEIAIRAAFMAVQDGAQIAILAPTTILADQHLHTFRERLAGFPLRIEGLSRFQTAAEQQAVVAGVRTGDVDIVIGTHRLLSKDVAFDDLGLLIVDEEQRFGVRQKEKLKELKESIDVLTLTATPIPRTLHLALGGIRDLSLIRTPPRNRMPIITHVLEWDDVVLEDALMRELDRGGQVFFVHDRVETIEALAERVRALVPEADVAVAHGQMSERELEDTMHGLMEGEVEVLVCTSIIENGLDVPNANTMIVHRADRFGLAQLYQLRGRVGRSHRRAYCYLILPPGVTREAEQRLRVLEHHTELGSGYQVALKDLELRGAGNLLGSEQSGFATAVGIETYQRLVTSTVRRLRGESSEEERRARVAIDGESLLPDDYVSESEHKMHLYRRLSRLTDWQEVSDLREELRDRFGPLPAQAARLLDAAELRILGSVVEASWIRASDDTARLTFEATATPQMGLLRNAFADRQMDVEVRRLQPLSLVLRRAGTEPLLPTLIEALRLLARASGEAVPVIAGGA
ncbi:MAG: transcription-repair coupling factor [Gemmatimonadota bacterium]|nr:transcription-repair coupling factor [Gemmatimonadota bacterium]